MNTLKIIVPLAASLSLMVLPGCDVLVQPVLVENSDLKTSARIIDPNAAGFSVSGKRQQDGRIKYTVDGFRETKVFVDQKFPFRVPYHASKTFTKRAVVDCLVNGKKYPALLDSGGLGSALLINQLHVNENHLPVYFFNDANGHPYKKAGLALIDDLQIGRSHFYNVPAVCLNEQEKAHLLGLIPVSQDKEIVILLGMMRYFRYILFDDIHQEVEFSAEVSFLPEDESGWERFPISIVDDFLFVNIPMVDEEIPFIVDTGAGVELLVSGRFFEKIKTCNPQATFDPGRHRDAFFRFIKGCQKCQQIPVHNVRVAGKTIKKTTLWVLEDAPDELSKLSEGIIGFDFFEKTVMVLDFEHNVMWVKKAKGSRFEE